MTPRQRWLNTLDGKPLDRLATDIWATGEVIARLENHFGCEGMPGVYRALDIDGIYSFASDYIGPPAEPGKTIYGVGKEEIDYGDGKYVENADPPLARATTAADIEAYDWPDPAWFDFSRTPEKIDANHDNRIVRAGGDEPFLLYCAMRGIEQAFIDLIAEPAIAQAALQKIFEINYENNRKLYEAGGGRIDLFYLAEDLGSQHGPLFSVDTYKRFLMPHQKAMAELVHAHGGRVFYHTDGAARDFLPLLIGEVGIDVLNPLQWNCPGMELAGLVRDFGKDVAFHGGIDNQHTLPFGTPDDVRQQVHQIADIMSGARWVCAPCHNIQPNTPVENIIAMYEAAHACAV